MLKLRNNTFLPKKLDLTPFIHYINTMNARNDILKEKLNWNHRNKIRKHLEETNHPLAEYCFANLYFFRKTHEYELLDDNGNLYMTGKSYDEKRYIMPLQPPECEDGTPCSEKLIEYFKEEQFDMIFPIPEEWLNRFPEDKFTREYNENDSDYIYETELLASLAGRKRHKKRNLRKQFMELYEPGYEIITKENTHKALELLEIWRKEKDFAFNIADYLPCKESLKNWDDFCLEGAIIYADGKPAGFLTGEGIGKNTFTIHFAKGDISYKGIYSYMFSVLADHLKERYQLINMEQDLGEEGLRRTKKSYVPAYLAHKYRIVPK